MNLVLGITASLLLPYLHVERKKELIFFPEKRKASFIHWDYVVTENKVTITTVS